MAKNKNPLGLPPAGRLKTKCPHCESPADVRTSEQVSRVTRSLKFSCRNPDCGHTWVALLEAVHTISPSAMPHPDVKLPIGKGQTPQRNAQSCK